MTASGWRTPRLHTSVPMCAHTALPGIPCISIGDEPGAHNALNTLLRERNGNKTTGIECTLGRVSGIVRNCGQVGVQHPRASCCSNHLCAPILITPTPICLPSRSGYFKRSLSASCFVLNGFDRNVISPSMYLNSSHCSTDLGISNSYHGAARVDDEEIGCAFWTTTSSQRLHLYDNHHIFVWQTPG